MVKKISGLLVLLIFISTCFSQSISFDNTSGESGSIVVVPVRVTGFTSIISMQGTIEFNSTVLSFHSAEQFGLTGLSNSNFGTSQTSSGKLSFSWFDNTLAGITKIDNSIVFALKFQVTGSSGQQTALNFTNSVAQMEFINNSFNPVVFSTNSGNVSIIGNTTFSLTIKADSLTANTGSQVIVPIRVSGFSNMLSMQGTIEFDAAKISYLSTQQFALNGLNSSSFGVSQASSGKISFSWSDPNVSGQTIADNSILFTIVFNVVGSSGQHSAISFTNSITPIEFIDANLNTVSTASIPGNVEITSIPHQNLTLILDSVAASPGAYALVPLRVKDFSGIVSAQGTISFDQNIVTFISAEQFNLSGLDSGSFGTNLASSGKITFSWSDATLLGQTLADSTIICKLKFYVNGSVGQNSNISWSNNPTAVEVINSSFNPVSVSLKNGKVEILNLFEINISNVNKTSFCTGDSIYVSYTLIGNFDAGNMLKLQLSDASGSFLNSTILDSVQSSSDGNISSKIPINIVSGTNYKIRISSSSPQVTGTIYASNISVINYPTSQATSSFQICIGDTVILNASAGESYLWNTIETSNSVSVMPNASQNYFVTVTNGGQCSIIDTFIVNVNMLPVISAGNDTSVCKGSTATLTASGGLSYIWNTSSNTETINVNPTITTSYYVTGTDANQCSNNDSVIVSVNFVIADAGPDASVCSGSNALLVASGGAAYSWNTLASNDSITVNPTITTTYTVTVTDTNSCTGTDSVTVFVNGSIPSLSVPAGLIEVCQNNENTTYKTLPADGGITYIWTIIPAEAGTFLFQNDSCMIDWNNDYSGTAQLSVTGQNGCGTGIETSALQITINSAPVVNLGNDTSFCTGNSVTLDASNAGASYQWNNTSSEQTLQVNAGGYYSVTVTKNNCSNYDSILVSEISLSVFLGNDTTLCNENTITLNAGNPGSDYLWNDMSTNQTLSNAGSGTYSVLVTKNGCSNTDTINIINQNLFVNLGNDTTICHGTLLSLDAENTGANYLWSDMSTNQTLINVTAGTYHVLVNSSNCNASDTINIFESNPEFSFTQDTILTSNLPVMLDAGYGFTTYSWSTQENTQQIYATQYGTYIVTVTDEYGCTDTDSVYIDMINYQKNIESDLVKIWPNPATDILFFNKPCDFDVYSLAGQLVLQGKRKQIASISMLQQGVYSLVINSKAYKIIKL